jgi:integrase
MTQDEILARLESRLRAQSSVEKTITRYLSLSRLYLEFSNSQFTRELVEEFLSEYEDTSSTYRRFLMYVLKGLFGAAGETFPFRSREFPKISQPSQPFLSIDQAEKLINAAKDDPLAYALFRLSAVTGARREEYTRMLDSDFNSPQIQIRAAKGEDIRIRTLDTETCDSLNEYRRFRKRYYRETDKLFLSRSGKALTTNALSVLFREYADDLGLDKGVGFHAIRRGLTTWLYKLGMRERELQDIMGWRSDQMPSRYIRLVSSDVDQKAAELNPFANR